MLMMLAYNLIFNQNKSKRYELVAFTHEYEFLGSEIPANNMEEAIIMMKLMFYPYLLDDDIEFTLISEDLVH